MTPPTTPERVRSLILGVLRDVQLMSGRAWSGLAADAKPIGALDGFDSLSAVEVTVMIEEKLGRQLGVKSVFVSEDGTRALTLAEMSARVSRLVGARGAAK